MPGKANFSPPAYTMNLLTNGKHVYICAVLYSSNGSSLWYFAESVNIIHEYDLFDIPLLI